MKIPLGWRNLFKTQQNVIRFTIPIFVVFLVFASALPWESGNILSFIENLIEYILSFRTKNVEPIGIISIGVAITVIPIFLVIGKHSRGFFRKIVIVSTIMIAKTGALIHGISLIVLASGVSYWANNHIFLNKTLLVGVLGIVMASLMIFFIPYGIRSFALIVYHNRGRFLIFKN